MTDIKMLTGNFVLFSSSYLVSELFIGLVVNDYECAWNNL